MSETTPQAKDQLPANMTALHRQLEEMAARTNSAKHDEGQQVQAGEPNLVIGGSLSIISPVSETVK
jgi:hypothetical protein